MSGFDLIALGVLLLALLPVVYFDLSQRRIPNLCNFALLILGIAVQLLFDLRWQSAIQIAASVAITLVAAFALWWGAKLTNRPEAIGLGDLKFLVAASAWLGFVGAAAAFVLAAVASVLWALAVSPWQGFDLKRELPFAPFLAVGALAMFAVVSLSN